MQETRQFESDNRWFRIIYPKAWQVEFEDGIYTLTKADDSSWAFQISAYKTVNDSIPNFDIDEELQRIVEIHPKAKIVALPNRKAIYYTERRDDSLLYIWIIGGKKCKAFCSYTADASTTQNANLDASRQVINTMKLQ
ncbi:DUF3805 domain-containing protein [Hymenobacter coccineus]|uniref:DUF3805 domain-containing protein n=1 Tax=Hymenobacter coccineus TaxID=1908235 RepID=UPI0013017E8E|nr:DUF3805 domain-containing protein [Hymenobacter coccineus]